MSDTSYEQFEAQQKRDAGRAHQRRCLMRRIRPGRGWDAGDRTSGGIVNGPIPST